MLFRSPSAAHETRQLHPSQAPLRKLSQAAPRGGADPSPAQLDLSLLKPTRTFGVLLRDNHRNSQQRRSLDLHLTHQPPLPPRNEERTIFSAVLITLG